MKSAFEKFAAVEEWFVGSLLMALTGILFLNVVMRFVFNNSLGWAEEFSRYSIVWVTMIGSSLCVRRGTHIAIDPLSRVLSDRGLRLLNIAVMIFCAIACAVFCYYAWTITEKIGRLGQRSATLNMPMAVVYAAMPVGFALMAVHFLISAVGALGKGKA
jgi:C4-dicarboxylate transporter DctQ subunit